MNTSASAAETVAPPSAVPVQPGTNTLAGPTAGASAKPPVLFIHGFWHGDWCWADWLEHFRAAGYNARAMNLRKHGEAFAGPRRLFGASLRKYVADVEAASRAWTERPVLIGHSLGCLLIEAAQSRIQPRAIVLVAPARHASFRRSSFRFARAHPLLFTRQFFTFTIWPTIQTPQLCREMFFSPRLPEAELLTHHQRLQNDSHFVALQLLFGAGPKPILNAKTPTLVLGGALDRAILPSDVKEVAADHATEAVILPGVGHDVMLDVDRDRSVQLVLQWLESTLAPAKQF